MSEKRDYYEVLEVERDADQKTIKRAFLKKAREVHPDVSNDPQAEELFKEVNEAYSVLSDPQKRAQYDQFGFSDPGQAGFGGFGGMDDIFDIFNSMFGGNARTSRSSSRPSTTGKSFQTVVSISLQEAATGCKRTVSLEHTVSCEHCEATGSEDKTPAKPCKRCHGSGVVENVQQTPFGYMSSQQACPDCSGIGSTFENPCTVCGGMGRVSASEQLSVTIPAGVYHSQKIRLAGKGDAGIRGGQAGDLLVVVSIEDDDQFERRGSDLYTVLKLNVFEALVGTVKHIAGIMPDEEVAISVPEGSSYRDTVKVPDYGMPISIGDTSSRGDLYAILEVVMPDDLTDAEKEELKAMRDARLADELDVFEPQSTERTKKAKRPRKKPKRK